MTGKARSKVRQGDISKALKAAKAAGLPVSGFEIDENGKMTFQVANGSRIDPSAEPFDSWKASRDARQA